MNSYGLLVALAAPPYTHTRVSVEIHSPYFELR